MISEVLTVIAPVFIIAGLGYFWVKRELPFDNATISSLVMYVDPCLIYSALTSNAAETTALGTMGASAFLVILMSLIFSWVFLKIVGWKLTTYLPALIHLIGEHGTATGAVGFWTRRSGSGHGLFSSTRFHNTLWAWLFRLDSSIFANS